MAHADDSSMLTGAMEECIQACLDCHASCLDVARHCLHDGGSPAATPHVTLLLDCADCCRASANFMLRDSPLHGRLCGLCAELCRACERECRASAEHDAGMLRCADACRRCAAACERVVDVVAA
jgi:hypothetical protein